MTIYIRNKREKIMDEIKVLSENKAEYSGISQELLQKLQLEDLPYTEESLAKKYNGIYNTYIKRIIDLFLALILIILISPLYILVSLGVVIDTGFPILYKADRGGYKGKTFRIMKFRTMVKNADKIGGGTTALKDSRITRVGNILRKTKLDEITQLLNIINGTMSFIGPRPELVKYVNQYEGLEKNILNVRPGITDFSSLYLINLDEIVGNQNADEIYEKYVFKKKNQLRLRYVAEVSFVTDIKLFTKTVLRVIKKALRVILHKKSKTNDIVEAID